MIENWKKAYKFFSVQLLAALIVLAGLEPFVPQISAILPEHWVPWFAALILFSRLVSQSKKPTDPNVLIEAAARAGATLKKGSAMIVLLTCVGCTKAPDAKLAVPNDEEAECIALEMARKTLEETSCGDNVEGPCSSKAIMKKSKEKRLACLEKY